MTRKRSSLKSSMEAQSGKKASTSEKASSSKAKATAKTNTRKETSLIGGHYPKEVHQQFKILAIEQDKTNQDLLAEAINDIFIKYGKSAIA